MSSKGCRSSCLSESTKCYLWHKECHEFVFWKRLTRFFKELWKHTYLYLITRPLKSMCTYVLVPYTRYLVKCLTKISILRAKPSMHRFFSNLIIVAEQKPNVRRRCFQAERTTWFRAVWVRSSEGPSVSSSPQPTRSPSPCTLWASPKPSEIFWRWVNGQVRTVHLLRAELKLNTSSYCIDCFLPSRNCLSWWKRLSPCLVLYLE